MKIRVGMSIYNDMPFLKESLEASSKFADEIYCVDGFYKGHPRMNENDFSRDDSDNIAWKYTYNRKKGYLKYHHNLEQHIKRDYYLMDLKEGDIIIVLDGDEVLVTNNDKDVRTTIEQLFTIKGVEAIQIPVHLSKNKEYQCSSIRIYRFKEGMKHNVGQLLVPYDPMKVLTTDKLKIIHYKDQRTNERKELQKEYFKRNKQ